LKSGFELVPEYKQTLIRDFLSDIETTDFLMPEEAAKQINSWVSYVTHNRVPTILDPGKMTTGVGIESGYGLPRGRSSSPGRVKNFLF
jgi:serine protease inhibitor